MRLDADERWTKKALEELSVVIEDNGLAGIYVKLKIYFMDRWIKHGGFYPNYFLRVFKSSKSRVENRFMDEHIIVSGKTTLLKNDIIEYNKNDRNFSLSNFITKHNDYSTREAVEMLVIRHNLKKMSTIGNLFGQKTERKRWVKENIYAKLPLFLRPSLYFIYRYFFQLGFLDGKEGFIFHFLQGFWYRFLADAKVYEVEKKSKKEEKSITRVIKEIYGINIQ